MRKLFLLFCSICCLACSTKQKVSSSDVFGTSAYSEDLSPCSVFASDGIYSKFIKVAWEQGSSKDGVEYHIYRSITNDIHTSREIQKTREKPYKSNLLFDFMVEPGVKYYYWIAAQYEDEKFLNSDLNDSGFIPEPVYYVAPTLFQEDSNLYVITSEESLAFHIQFIDKKNNNWNCIEGFTPQEILLDTVINSFSFKVPFQDDVLISAAVSDENRKGNYSTPYLFDVRDQNDLLGSGNNTANKNPFFKIEDSGITFHQQEMKPYLHEVYHYKKSEGQKKAVLIKSIYSFEKQFLDKNLLKGIDSIWIQTRDLDSGQVIQKMELTL